MRREAQEGACLGPLAEKGPSQVGHLAALVGWEPPCSGSWGFRKATELVQPGVGVAQEQIQIPVYLPVSLCSSCVAVGQGA